MSSTIDLPPSSPLKVHLKESPLRVVEGSGYVQAIKIGRQLEVQNVTSIDQLHRLMHEHAGEHRQVVLGQDPPPEFPSTDGCVYLLVNLPAGDLGLQLGGFPAMVESVDKSSPLRTIAGGLVHAGQAVHAASVPGEASLDKLTPGFTGALVQEYLARGDHSEGRSIVVGDVVDGGSSKRSRKEVSKPGEAALFDFGRLFRKR